ncbi:MAG: TrkH family potassium uptake protein, partial [bacterium]
MADFRSSELHRNLSVLHVFGLITLIFGITMALPLGVSRWLDDGASAGFDRAIAITAVAGAVTWLSTLRYRRELEIRDAFLLVVMVWA